MLEITTQIILETNLYMSFEIKDNKLCFELDKPENEELTITIYFVDVKIKTIIRQDEQIEPLDVGSYIFLFNTEQKTALSVIFNDNKLAFEILPNYNDLGNMYSFIE
jgi:hypothetical protein